MHSGEMGSTLQNPKADNNTLDGRRMMKEEKGVKIIIIYWRICQGSAPVDDPHLSKYNNQKIARHDLCVGWTIREPLSSSPSRTLTRSRRPRLGLCKAKASLPATLADMVES